MKVLLKIEDITNDIPPGFRTDKTKFDAFIKRGEQVARQRLELRPNDTVETIHPGHRQKINIIIARSSLGPSVYAYDSPEKAAEKVRLLTEKGEHTTEFYGVEVE